MTDIVERLRQIEAYDAAVKDAINKEIERLRREVERLQIFERQLRREAELRYAALQQAPRD